jgi:hypothetical protein
MPLRFFFIDELTGFEVNIFQVSIFTNSNTLFNIQYYTHVVTYNQRWTCSPDIIF